MNTNSPHLLPLYPKYEHICCFHLATCQGGNAILVRVLIVVSCPTISFVDIEFFSMYLPHTPELSNFRSFHQVFLFLYLKSPYCLNDIFISSFMQVDYVKGKLWYNEKCFANREHFEGKLRRDINRLFSTQMAYKDEIK